MFVSQIKLEIIWSLGVEAWFKVTVFAYLYHAVQTFVGLF